ncbi:Separase [Spironucleus salmonicida]|uniref:Separase n=1 Tax=Spironucleus salmonicida TaxID=348837 RepID=V6LHN1_9EUKA|nr:Separase [Spironucleus salmonicida]|eukprot:EST44062.1 Separase [Spironucleus salmonicida]
MNQQLLDLQCLLKQNIFNNKTLNLSYEICLYQDEKFVLQILKIFAQRPEFSYLLLASFLNKSINVNSLFHYTKNASKEPLVLIGCFLQQYTVFIQTLIPTQTILDTVKSQLATNSYQDFVYNVNQIQITQFQEQMINDLAQQLLFNRKQLAQFTSSRQIDQFVNCLLMTNQLQQQQIILNKNYALASKKLNFSVSKYSLFQKINLDNQLKKQISLINDTLTILFQFDQQLLLQGPFYFINSYSSKDFQYNIIQLIDMEILQPDCMLKLIINLYGDYSMDTNKKQVIEVLSLFYYQYLVAYSSIKIILQHDNYQLILKDISSHLIGFMLNVTEYSSILIGIQVKLSFYNIQVAIYSQQFIQIIFNLRKLSEIKIINQSQLDQQILVYHQLYLFTSLSMVQQGQQLFAAKHINSLLSTDKQILKIQNLIFMIKDNNSEFIQLYFNLLLIELLFFDINYFYGQIIFQTSKQLQIYIVKLFNQHTVHQTCIVLLKQVQIYAQKQPQYSNIFLLQRFKMIEYQLGNQINKALVNTIIGDPIKQMIQLYLQQENQFIYKKIYKQNQPVTAKLCRATLQKTHDYMILQNIDSLLDTVDSSSFKIVLSNEYFSKNTYLFISIQNTLLFKLSLQTQAQSIQIPVQYTNTQPQNLSLEIEAIKQLQLGNIIGFIFNRFQSLSSTLETSLASYSQSQIQDLQKLDNFYMQFYNALPFLLFGPLVGLTRYSQTKQNTENNIESNLDQNLYTIAKLSFQSINQFKLFNFNIQQDQILKIIFILLSNEHVFNFKIKQKVYDNFTNYLIPILIKPTFLPFSLNRIPFATLELSYIQQQNLDTFILFYDKLNLITDITHVQRISIDPILNQIPLENTFSFINTIRYLKTSQKMHITASEQLPPSTNLFFVDSSLPQTQIRIRELLNNQKQSWVEITKPQAIIDSIKSTQHFIFAGHGGAENLLPHHKILQLESLPEAAILGCSSLCGNYFSGGRIRYTPEKNWRHGSIVIGCLWDMLSGELDRFAQGYVDGGMGIQGSFQGRKKMLLKSVFGVGIVVYG